MAEDKERKMSLRSEAANARLKEFNVRQEPSEVDKMRMKLENMKTEITETLEESHKILTETTKHLVKFFAQIPAEDLSERIKATFTRFDANGDGTLQRNELKLAFKEMGKDMSEEEIAAVIEQYDVNENNCIDLPEFEHMVRQTLEVQCKDCEICTVMQARIDAALAEERRLEEEMNANKDARVKAKEEALAAARARRIRLSQQYKDPKITGPGWKH